MGGGRAKKAVKKANKPAKTAGKATKKIGGLVRFTKRRGEAGSDG